MAKRKSTIGMMKKGASKKLKAKAKKKGKRGAY